ncbi:MAG: DUF2490 domain-containing protein [Sphingomonadales bacterium]|nr:MAG: DUF2490 domain-containing protein [Sphingomonadales bacterium]
MLRYALPLLLLSLPAAAQRVDEQLWLQANAEVKVDEDTSITLESIGRFSDRADGFAHSEFGGILSHKLSDSVEIGLGYRHIQDYDHGRSVPNEERVRQTITVTLAPRLTTRTRFEQTFSSAGPGVALRLRQQLRLTHPIGGGLDVFATHESFLLVNDVRQRSGYERMRNTLGLQVPLSEKLRGEAGYLNQYRFGRAGAREQMDHIATFALTLAL